MRMIDDRPVHQIARMQDRQSRRAVEAGCGEIEIIADADHIRIGIIREQNRIAIGPVRLVRNPRISIGAFGGCSFAAQRRSDLP